jgi:hypothetical protein
MWFKWFEAGRVPPWPRIDSAPRVMMLAALSVVAFELSMPLLVSFRRTRPIALVAVLAFHLACGHWLDVLFPSLALSAIVLVPTLEERGRKIPRRLGALALAFSCAIVVQGVRGQTQSWPFACYPTFEALAPDVISDLAVDVVRDDGSFAGTYRLPIPRRPDEWGLVWRLAGLYGDPVDRRKLDAFARVTAPSLGPGERHRFMRETYDVSPDARGCPPLERMEIGAF